MSVNAINVDSAGTELAKPATYAGVYSVTVRQSTAASAGVIVWGLNNPTGSGKTVLVRSSAFQMYFDGTAAATLMKYEMVKYTGVTAFSGGSAVTAMHKRTSLAGAVAAVARVLDTGLTATSGTAQAIVPLGAMGRVTQTTTNFQSTWTMPLAPNERGTLNAMAIELAPGELLAIRPTVTCVIGDNIVGYIETAEY
jgi:hypothetical protein